MQIIEVNWTETIAIRHRVLWPNKPPEFCKVSGDEQALHFAARTDNQLISVASIYLDKDKARLRKFATLTEFQGQGVGTKLLTFIIERLKQLDIDYLWFDARQSALPFYQRLGFESYGKVFYKSDVAYLKMSKHL